MSNRNRSRRRARRAPFVVVIFAAIRRSMARDVMLFAGGASFFGMLALFPALALAMSVYGVIFSIEDAQAQFAQIAGVMPSGAQDFLLDQMSRIADAPISVLSVQGGVALAISLFAAARGAKALIAGLNHLAEDRDIRNVLHFNIIAMISVLIGGALLLIANTAVFVIPVVLKQVLDMLGLEALDFGLFINEWTGAGLTMFTALSLLYRLAMRRREHAIGWRASLSAALTSTLVWLALSRAFSTYVTEVVDFGIYGSLGALVVFLLWIYWSAYAVFFGGALAVEIDGTGTVTDEGAAPATA
jgi:membrane protein